MSLLLQKLLPTLRKNVKSFLHLSPEKSTGIKEKMIGRLEPLPVNLKGQLVSNEIERLISNGQPMMVARLGSGELRAVLKCQYIKNTGTIEKVRNLAFFGKEWWWVEHDYSALCNNAGFFPYSYQNMERFSELMIPSIRNVDILGSSVAGENMFRDELKNAVICPLPDLEPYYHQNPWSIALKNKNVLVVHPFAQSIEKQYSANRQNLFKNPNVLPEFNLIVFKAVQSIAGNKTGFQSWFEALDWMTDGIGRIDFDIAIIGCGAYGFPLASRIKDMGKQAIQLGGATQILFGIKGKRWDDYPPVSKFYNSFWVRPMSDEIPENANSVENACYW